MVIFGELFAAFHGHQGCRARAAALPGEGHADIRGEDGLEGRDQLEDPFGNSRKNKS